MSVAAEPVAAPPAALVPLRLVAGPLLLGFLAEAPGWVLVAVAWPAQGAWYGDPTLRLGLHLVTLGGLVLPVVGAGWQLVPVVTTRPLGARARSAATWANRLVVPGALATWIGFATGWPLAAAGAGALAAGLLLRAAVLVPALIRAPGRGGIRAWLLGAELALLAGLGLAGALLGGHLGLGAPGDAIARIHAHARALGAGWAGGHVIGLGTLLLPMFALGREPRPRLSAAVALAWFGALGVGSGPAWGAAALAAAGLLASGLNGPRAALRAPEPGGGPGLVQVRLGLLGLGVAGLAALIGVGAPLIGALVLVGWLLPVQHGLATRVVPFLLWAHVLADVPAARRPPAATLLPARLAWAQATVAGLGALAFCLGAGLPSPPLARVGAALLALAALLHVATTLGGAWTTLLCWRRAQALPGTEVR